MKISKLRLSGTFLIEPDEHVDNRGSFHRVYCENIFREHGLNARFVQHSISYNKIAHTLRGLHFQKSPHDEIKLIHCISGSIWDVVVDIRENSETYGQWDSIELSDVNKRTLYIPSGFAHGFITLEDHTRVFYEIDKPYTPDSSSGIVWDDSSLSIKWPHSPKLISDKDKGLPALVDAVLHK